MLPGFEQIVENRIKKAQQEGAFKNLSGLGKPLSFDDDSRIPEDLRLAYKILKNAGYVPPEVELKKEIRHMEDLFERTEDVVEKYRVLKKLNFLIMKLNSIRRGSITFDTPQYYNEKLVGRIGSGRAKDKKTSDM